MFGEAVSISILYIICIVYIVYIVYVIYIEYIVSQLILDHVWGGSESCERVSNKGRERDGSKSMVRARLRLRVII